MRTAVVTQKDLPLKAQSKNPIAKDYQAFFERSFGQAILPEATPEKVSFSPEDARLYLSQRKWLVDDLSEDEAKRLDAQFPYEAYVHSWFWRDKDRKRLIFITGKSGCGKSTFVDYYLRCYCPRDPKRKELFSKKLVLNIDVKGIQSLEEFDKRFFGKARKVILHKCASLGLKIHDELNTERCDPILWVELALKYISDSIKEYPFKERVLYLVLCIDNLDQTPLDVQARALRVVAGWLEPDSSIDLWQVFVPLWPNTLHDLESTGLFTPPREGYKEIRLGKIDYTVFIQSRNQKAQEEIARHNRRLVWRDQEGGLHTFGDDTAEFLQEAYALAVPKFIEFVDDITYGDLRRKLALWLGLISSRTMFAAHKQQLEHVGQYLPTDALITGLYSVHKKQESYILNLFYTLDVASCPHHLLVGPHILSLIQKGVGSY